MRIDVIWDPYKGGPAQSHQESRGPEINSSTDFGVK